MTTAAARQTQPGLEGRLERGLEELGIPLGPEAMTRLIDYLALLQKWNRVYNLTAIQDVEKMVSVHLLDCLAVVPHLGNGRVLDVGSGAGLPGIPLAVAKSGVHVSLLESSHKKAAFLRQAVAELRLKNADVICERVESWHPVEKFDWIVSRAFAGLAEFVALTGHLLAPGGALAAMKGVYPFEEIERLPPGFRASQVHRLTVPGLESERHLVLIERA